MIQFLIQPKIRFFEFVNLSKVGSQPENIKNCPYVPLNVVTSAQKGQFSLTPKVLVNPEIDIRTLSPILSKTTNHQP